MDSNVKVRDFLGCVSIWISLMDYWLKAPVGLKLFIKRGCKILLSEDRYKDLNDFIHKDDLNLVYHVASQFISFPMDMEKAYEIEQLYSLNKFIIEIFELGKFPSKPDTLSINWVEVTDEEIKEYKEDVGLNRSFDIIEETGFSGIENERGFSLQEVIFVGDLSSVKKAELLHILSKLYFSQTGQRLKLNDATSFCVTPESNYSPVRV